MSKKMIGSICFSDLLEQAKKGHTAFTRADNGKIYANISLYIKDEPDQFKNNASISIVPKVDTNFTFEFIGNMKWVEPKIQDLSQEDIKELPESDTLPF